MEPDINQIVSATVSDLIKSSFSRVIDGSSNALKSAWQKVSEDFSDYMDECYTRNRFVRILCNGDSDVDLLDIYVGSNFTTSSRTLKDHEVVFRANEGDNLVICGNGGAGKTFFMRKLWLDLLHNSKRTPIFVELRKLNSLSKFDLISFLRGSISSKGNLADSLFESFCESGRFTFILDGFDEVIEERHEDLQEQIAGMADRYPGCPIVVSSRFDGRFAGWQRFTLLEASPFTRAQTRELCTKVPFDPKIKGLFIKKLTADFFKENSMFLSNPLLSVMMMMTFKANMDIPKKISIFYEQAFNTLFQYHDSTKAFKREKLLDIHQFRNSFGLFSLLSYYVEMFEFTKSELIEKIEQSNKLNGYKFDAEKVLFDYEKSVNLLRQDGLRYVFIHRSFQEYFAADALVRLLPKKFGEICKLLEKRSGDIVLKFCFELQKNLVVSEYICPNHKRFSNELYGVSAKKIKSPFPLLEFLGAIFSFSIPPNSEVTTPQVTAAGHVSSVGLHFQNDHYYFLGAINRLMNGQPRFNNFGMDMFFGDVPTLFTNASSFVIECSLETSGGFDIVFVDGQPIVRPFGKDQEAGSVDNYFELPLTSALYGQLEACARNFRSSVDRVGKWCELEIAESGEKDRSLSEVFGL